MIRIVIIVTSVLLVLVGLATLDLLDFIIKPTIKILVILSCKLIDIDRAVRKKFSLFCLSIKSWYIKLDLFDKLWKSRKYITTKFTWLKSKCVEYMQYFKSKLINKYKSKVEKSLTETTTEITIAEKLNKPPSNSEPIKENLDYTVKLNIEEINKIINKPSKCLNCNYHKNEHCPNFISCEYEKIGYCILSTKCGFLHRKTCKDYGNENCQVSSKLLFKDS